MGCGCARAAHASVVRDTEPIEVAAPERMGLNHPVENRWFLSSIDIRGGFLEAVSIELPEGLTCIIGPRGSGKSTLAEAIRGGLGGVEGASRDRQELFRSNLAKSAITLRARSEHDGQTFVVRREGRQPAVLTTGEGKVLSAVALDRGTFLPLDAYTSAEIETIADETLGPRRRGLLDELRATDLLEIQGEIAEARRGLEASADRIRASRRGLVDLTEEAQALVDARDRLAALPVASASEHGSALAAADQQRLHNEAEQKRARKLYDALAGVEADCLRVATTAARDVPTEIAAAQSANAALAASLHETLAVLHSAVTEHVAAIQGAIDAARVALRASEVLLAEAHLGQASASAQLRERDRVAEAAVRERSDAERAVLRLAQLEARQTAARGDEQALLVERQSLKAKYLVLRERVSALREEVVGELMAVVPGQVRLGLRRSADTLEYQQLVSQALHGSGLRQHDAIVESVTRFRPDELAQIVRADNLGEFEAVCRFGADRAKRVLDALRQALDPLTLEVLPSDDVVSIELNVGTPDDAIYRDAAHLSRGQKCTALLPLLLARRRTPLVVDQPEDNLDNAFIFRTVVESIRRLKPTRQLLFITHNANIPVLGEADCIVVMDSDGRRGFVRKVGSLDECREDIIELLEGGAAAFDLRRQRYGRS